jgi:hypothetical protein
MTGPAPPGLDRAQLDPALGLQIVDNLHPASSNGNVLKPSSTRGRARSAANAPALGPVTPAAPAEGPRAPRTVADDHPIALLQTNSLPALVQREIERMILAGDLAAGAQLRETEVAAMLGVSRGPVREAFRALEESGLVRLEKNRGVFVRQIGVEEADDIFELRVVESWWRRTGHCAGATFARSIRGFSA